MIFRKILFAFMIALIHARSNYEQLPNCMDNSVLELVLVSTIDGKLSALTSKGTLQWEIETEPGPLLTSNIHSLELTNSGKWIRIIPSLSGSLYRFDGVTLDPLAISADSLLKSSFKYSDDLVIAGGFEVRTYGIGFRTGKLFYTCSSVNCINNTDNGNEGDDILLVERNTQTVRAVESQSGHERWNFSVGHHNIKLPQITCTNSKANLFNWNITAVIPDGVLSASSLHDKTTWQYNFPSPIVRVWTWNGHRMTEVDLFQIKNDNEYSDETRTLPAVYIGMHNRQLYIHESGIWQNRARERPALAETASFGKIPWNPVSAAGLSTENSSTAVSVLYSSEYVNGQGYYLYSEHDAKRRSNDLCENNSTVKKIPVVRGDSESFSFGHVLSLRWKELLVILMTTTALCNFMFRSIAKRNYHKKDVIFVERHVEVPLYKEALGRISESSDENFNSRFLNDFDTLRCLGKGGFGVVFEVKQKIDECHYAIKRIILPNEETKREAVMREVKALAKLEHHNIVRYFNSWLEKPPSGWQQQHDSNWLNEGSEYPTEEKSSSYAITKHYKKSVDDGNTASDSYIVFGTNSKISKGKNSRSLLTEDDSNRTDTILYDDFHPSSGGVNWRRPSRRYHRLNDLVQIPDESPAFLYIQMQLCQRQSLKEWLIENSDRRFSDVLNVFKQIVSAVEYVHLHGLIHRDLKPSNIFFAMDGQIKVGDFGLVKYEEESYECAHVGSSLRGHTKDVGTSLYMSPEQLNGMKYNYKVDIYSLGLIFFELLVHFSTDMERIRTITDLRENRFPEDFVQQRIDEYNLLTMMLCESPEKRLTTFGIRARPPLNCCDSDYDETYDFELPKSSRNAALTVSKT